jgi:hypothetical protein
LNIPNVSVTVDITNIAGARLSLKGSTGAINFDVKAKLEEKEHRTQIVIVNFTLLLTTKPSVVKFEVEGTATLTGKDKEIIKMLEVDPEMKVPYVFQKIYQNAFAAMYVLSNILKAPPPPHVVIPSPSENNRLEGVDVQSRVGEAMTEEHVEEATEKSTSMESGEKITEGPETATQSVDVKPTVSETRAEERVEERTEGLSSTES